MISCLSTTCRTRQALRAVLVTLVALTGCQGSMRTWRRDDPSLRDLVVTPHPLDQSATGNEPYRDSSAAYNRSAKKKAGRANPYAQSKLSADARHFEPTDDVAEVGANEDWDEPAEFPVENPEIKSLVSEANPEHRAMLVRMYQALQARANPDEEVADESSPLLAKTKSNRKSNDEVVTADYSSSNRNQPVRQTSGSRAVDRGDLGNHPTDDNETSHPNEPAHFRLSDDEPDESDRSGLGNKMPAVKTSSKLQDLQPPTKSRAGNRSADPVADTGYEQQIQGLPPRGPRDNAPATSSRKHSHAQTPASRNAAGAYEADSHYTDQSQVVPASANSSTLSDETTIEPVTRRPARSSSRNSVAAMEQAPGQTTGETDEEPMEDWRELAHRTLRALEQEQVDSSTNAQLNHHVTKRILLVLLGQLEQALDPIPGLQPREQEYFRHSFQALHNSIDPRGNPVLSRRWPLVMEDHRTAMTHLGAVSNLEVKNAAFCSHVEGFGSITKIPSYQFRPNQELLLYCEIENFVSEQIKDAYETKLRGNYEIVDANQTRVADFILPEEVDVCKRPRRDYFFVYRIYMPQQIAPGRYQLRLTIEDMKGNKFGQTSLDMQVVN